MNFIDFCLTLRLNILSYTLSFIYLLILYSSRSHEIAIYTLTFAFGRVDDEISVFKVGLSCGESKKGGKNLWRLIRD